MSDIKLQTPKFDARFPNVNQTKNCWQNFVDYHKCRKAKGEDYHPCEYFKKTYKSLCPTSWVSVKYNSFELVLFLHVQVCSYREAKMTYHFIS